MDLGLRDKRAAVAAASKGLGFGVAQALAEEGVHVAICGRDQARVRQAAERIGERAVPLVCDVSSVEGATDFVARATDAIGPLDILVANAGGPPPGTFQSTPLDAYRVAVELNLMSTIAMCQAAVPGMRERGFGRVVAITSIGAREPIPFLIASGVARGGVTTFLKTLASEVAREGVTVNGIQPGTHATDRVTAVSRDLDALAQSIPVGFLGDASDFGRAVAFLCSTSARFITGTNLLVDGGASRGLS